MGNTQAPLHKGGRPGLCWNAVLFSFSTTVQNGRCCDPSSFRKLNDKRCKNSRNRARYDVSLIMNSPSPKIPEGLQAFLAHAESLHPSSNEKRENGFAKEFQVFCE